MYTHCMHIYIHMSAMRWCEEGKQAEKAKRGQLKHSKSNNINNGMYAIMQVSVNTWTTQTNKGACVFNRLFNQTLSPGLRMSLCILRIYIYIHDENIDVYVHHATSFAQQNNLSRMYMHVNIIAHTYSYTYICVFFLHPHAPFLQTTRGLVLNTSGRILLFGRLACAQSVWEMCPSATCKGNLHVVHRLYEVQPIHGSRLRKSKLNHGGPGGALGATTATGHLY